ncbi:hypothetical protein CBLAS_1638 [Campylobacter blaseri]|nr:hypothetical protein CBLAS_1638 [Campylobacter blaseri]
MDCFDNIEDNFAFIYHAEKIGLLNHECKFSIPVKYDFLSCVDDNLYLTSLVKTFCLISKYNKK